MNYNNERVTTALLLAAGTGSRLYPLTKNAPKCMTLVNGISIIERLTSCLNQYGFTRLVVITGHEEHCIRDFLGDQIDELKIDYIFNPLFKETNNIYSLWLAREIINEQFLLLESDLVFDESLLGDMLYPNRIAVAKMQPWLNGTCVTINHIQQVKAFYTKNTFSVREQLYKTVNMYSISLNSWHRILERLENYILDEKVNDYYEVVFAEMIIEGRLSFDSVSFDNKPWYEIDTIEDLAIAEEMFLSTKHITTKSLTHLHSILLKKKLNQLQ